MFWKDLQSEFLGYFAVHDDGYRNITFFSRGTEEIGETCAGTVISLACGDVLMSTPLSELFRNSCLFSRRLQALDFILLSAGVGVGNSCSEVNKLCQMFGFH